jgi:ferrous iron transport protein A
MPMSNLKRGNAGRVLSVSASGSLRQRLFDLGLLPGTVVERVMDSPIGDTACYRFRGAMIALRADDAGQISVMV